MAIFRRPVMRLILAGLWMMLQDSYRLDNFVAGLIVATIIEFVFPAPILTLSRPRFSGVFEFFGWLWASVKLVLVFFEELLRADWADIVHILSGRQITPGVIRMPLKATSPGQISLLCALITLTPGTVAMEIETDREAIYLNCLDASDEEAALATPRRFERLIMEVLR